MSIFTNFKHAWHYQVSKRINTFPRTAEYLIEKRISFPPTDNHGWLKCRSVHLSSLANASPFAEGSKFRLLSLDEGLEIMHANLETA